MEELLPLLMSTNNGFALISGTVKQMLPGLETFLSVTNTVASYVKYVDPGRIEILNMAFENLYAAIGSGLTPIIDAAIVVLRQMNQVVTSVMATLRPAFKQISEVFTSLASLVMAVLQPVFVTVAEMFSEMIADLKPIFDELMAAAMEIGAAFRRVFQEIKPELMAAFRLVIDMVVSGLRKLADAILWVLRQLGFSGGGAAIAPTGPQTIAARPAQMIGTEEIGQQARLAAFGSRSDLQVNTDATVSNTGAVNQLTSTLGNAISNNVAQFGAGVVNGLLNPIGFLLRPWGL